MATTFDEAQKRRYGFHGLEVLASNNPSCLKPVAEYNALTCTKRMYAFQCTPQFSSEYDTQLHPAILKVLEARNLTQWPVCFSRIHVIRMGFKPTNATPTLLIIFQQGHVSAELAKDIVSAIVASDTSSLLALHSPPVWIDICAYRPAFETRANDIDFNILAAYPNLYADSAPVPGSSIGLQEKKDRTVSILCYVQHEKDIFVVTNGDIASESAEAIFLADQPYKHIEGQPKHWILSPSDDDHKNIIESLQTYLDNTEKSLEHFKALNERQSYRTYLQNFQGDEAEGFNTYKVRSKGVLEDDNNCKNCKELLRDLPERIKCAQRYDRVLGYVVATSGKVQPPAIDGNRQDWGLIRCATTEGRDYQNRHRFVDYWGRGVPGYCNHTSFRLEEEVRKKIKCALPDTEHDCINWLDETEKYFATNPPKSFGPISDEPLKPNAVYLKAPSARRGFHVYVCNGVKTTLGSGQLVGITREWSFVEAQGQTYAIIEHGDSGAAMLDKDYKIAGMVWRGVDHCWIDLTYVTPITQILGWIEETMGWESGSCVWLEEESFSM